MRTQPKHLAAAALTAASLVIAVAAPARAQQPPNSHTCRPVTLGHAVLEKIGADFNLGFDNQDPTADVRGFQLHIDKDKNGFPDQSFVKWPDPWPVPGADGKNRVLLDNLGTHLLYGTADFGIYLTVDGFNAIGMEVDFSCHTSEFGGALTDGAVRAELRMQAASDDDELALQFRWHVVIDIAKIIKIDDWIIIDLVDIDLPIDQEIKLIAALVPKISADGESVVLEPHVNVDDAANKVTFGQIVDEVLLIEAIVTPILAAVICLPTGLGKVCEAPVTPIIAAIVGIAVNEVKNRLVDYMKTLLSGYILCLLAPFNASPGAMITSCDPAMPPAPGENKFIKTMGDALRVEIAKLGIPAAIASLPIPNYDQVVPYTPELVTNLCP